MKDSIKDFTITFLLPVIAIAGALSIGAILGYSWGYEVAKAEQSGTEIEYTHPVERNVIDTFYIERERVINNIHYIDSIKHDTIEKVYTLADTGILELFYQLLSE